MNKKKCFMVASSHSGGGKTTITQGLLAFFVDQDLKVQSYKLGPDYIDSGHHAKITGRPCINLDRFLLTSEQKDQREEVSADSLIEEFHRYAQDADVLVIESVGGLFDDWYGNKSSPAEMAKILQVPVIIVLDAFSSCQTLGIMANALLHHDPDLNIAGLIFSKLHAEEHFNVVTQPIKNKELLLGYFPYMKELSVKERHLGLLTAWESDDLFKKEMMVKLFAKHIDTSKLDNKEIEILTYKRPSLEKCSNKCTIAVAKDEAFCFYYEANIQLLQELGANIVYFSPLKDERLPSDVDALYLGGGYPENHAQTLAENRVLLDEIREAGNNGMPIYAECGGFIYLCNTLESVSREESYKMVSLFPFDIFFSSNLILSYVKCHIKKKCLIGNVGDIVRGHTFHHTQIKNRELHKVNSAYKMEYLERNVFEDEGFTFKNIFASYVHLHFRNCENVARNFINESIHYNEGKK